MKKFILLFFVLWIALVNNFSYEEENKKIYHPYPIIFVHGIDPGGWETFEDTRGNLKYYYISLFKSKN